MEYDSADDLPTICWSGSVELDLGDLGWHDAEVDCTYSEHKGSYYLGDMKVYLFLDIKTGEKYIEHRWDVSHWVSDETKHCIFENCIG